MSESQWVIDVDTAGFQADVLERSKSTPVVVDFWAEWCGPCKSLSPVLERLADEGAGRFVLAKVDIDRNPDLAQIFGVQSIPTVVGLVDGRVVDGFMGALPAEEIKTFLDKIAPPLAPDKLEQAREAEQAGDPAAAAAFLVQHLEAKPDDAAAGLFLARMRMASGDADEAQRVFDTLPAEAKESAEGDALAKALQLAASSDDLDALRRAAADAPDDLAKRIELGQALAAAGAHEEGLETLLAAVHDDPHFEHDAARKAMLSVFEILGDEHPLSIEFRQRLQVALF